MEINLYPARHGYFFEVWDARGLVAHGWRATLEAAERAVAYVLKGGR